MAYDVYILQSQKDKKYHIRESADVAARPLFHNAGKQCSARSRVPFIIVPIEQHENREKVLQKEKQIKSWKGGDAFKQLVFGTYPRLSAWHQGGAGVAS